MELQTCLRTVLCATALCALTACGGGDGGGSFGGNNPPGGGGNPGSGWVAGVYQPSETFAAQCAAPRSGVSATTGIPFPDTLGSILAENNWLRSWSNELYLWYRELPDVDPGTYSTTAEYFEILKTPLGTPSGAPKDQFHFTLPTDQWEALSQSGVSFGYGVQWAVLSSTPPRDFRVAYTEPGSPAANVGIARGARLLAIDGVSIDAGDSASIDILNAGLTPQNPGEVHTFTVRDLGSAGSRTVTLIADEVTSTPVQNVSTIPTPTGNVGYMLFNDHIATSETALIAAFTQLSNAGAQDLVLDLRYNGGGLLGIASEVAFMIAGPTATAGRTFEDIQFNDKYPNTNPVTGEPLTPAPFVDTAIGFSAPTGQPLPSLGLNRVFVITGPDTCSASESIINSLRGIDVRVIQIGSTTCGKPYGFYPADNCGTTYFSVQFRGVNAKGFGDYADGFTPAHSSAGDDAAMVPGCRVADDFSRLLGDQTEGRLAAALYYRTNGSCQNPPSGRSKPNAISMRMKPEPLLYKSPWQSNRILTLKQ